MGRWAGAKAMTVGRDGSSGDKLLSPTAQSVSRRRNLPLFVQCLSPGTGLKASNVHICIESTLLLLNMTG